MLQRVSFCRFWKNIEVNPAEAEPRSDNSAPAPCCGPKWKVSRGRGYPWQPDGDIQEKPQCSASLIR